MSTDAPDRMNADRTSRARKSGPLRLTLVSLALLAASAGSALAVTPIVAPLPPGTTTIVNAGNGDQLDPHVSGSIVSYTNVPGAEIRYYDFTTGLDTAISHGGAVEDSLSDVSGSRIVYSRLSAVGADIYSLSVGGSTPTELAPGITKANRESAAIGGDTVAWVDLGSTLATEREIFTHNLGSVAGGTTRLTNDSFSDIAPAVSPDGNVIVWIKCFGVSGGLPCTVHQAVEGTTTALPFSGDVSQPDTDGALVVYRSIRNSEADIYWRPVAGGAEERLELPGDQRDASISGGLIVFESTEPFPFGLNSEVKVYDIVSNTLYNVTGSPQPETLADIDYDAATRRVRVVLTQSNTATGEDVLASTFTLPNSDTVAPVLTVPAPIAVDATGPAGAAVAYTVTATDNVSPSPTVSCVPPSGSTFPTGTSTVSCTATDAAGNRSTAGFTVFVRGASAQIGALITKTLVYLHVPALKASVQAWLQAAINATVAGNKPAACSALALYIAIVRVTPAGVLTTAQRAELIADATRIRNVLGC